MNFWVHNRTIEKWRKKWKNDSRVKTRKGSLEQKWENFWKLVGEANGRMKRRRSDNIWSLYEVLYPFQNQKFDTFYSRMISPEFPNLSRLVLTPVKLSYSGTKKWIFLRCLIFKEFIFPEKCLGNVSPLLLNQIVKISLWGQIIRFQVNVPFKDFLIVITNFFGSLKSKGRWLFMNNKSSFENILVSGVVEASFWK